MPRARLGRRTQRSYRRPVTLGGDVYPYVKRHNPFAYFSDVVNSPAQANNIVPFAQFAQDLASNRFRTIRSSFRTSKTTRTIVPRALPNCTNADKLAAADKWLKTNIDPLISSAAFRQSGLLVLTWDESVNGDTENGGGQVTTVVISSKANQGFESNTLFQHQSVLRLTAEALGLASYPGAAATANNMSEFFSGAPNTAPIVAGVSPASGPTAGGTTVTISGTGFANGASVSFGGTAASNVTVVGSTTITAVAPAHFEWRRQRGCDQPGGEWEQRPTRSPMVLAPPGETVLLVDDFNLWRDRRFQVWITNNLFSGFTDTTVALQETTQFRVGPLKQSAGGSHYNGIDLRVRSTLPAVTRTCN